MITLKDLQPVIVALESISVRGAQDVGTMKNIFDYLVMLQNKANEQPVEQESETDKYENLL